LKTVLFGATRGMGRALARLLAERGDELVLLGRDPAELEKSAKDLEIRAGGAGHDRVGTEVCDLFDRKAFGSALDAAVQRLGGLDAVIVTAGVFGTQDELTDDADLLDRVLVADFVNTVHFCEEARLRLLESGGGKLCVFSSVAGERARRTIFLYGAAKAGLSYYLEGLDHRYRGEGLATICVKPGFVRTSMTAGLDPPPFTGEPEAVARTVLRAIDRGRPVVYAPPIWRWIMLTIRWLPRAVMRRLRF
jgi:NAD(P)-dependent dehydrogenase (short-subunit alcohol dehydrogenase family)